MKKITTRQYNTNERYTDPDVLAVQQAQRERMRTLAKQPLKFDQVVSIMHNKSVGHTGLRIFEGTRRAAKATALEVTVTPAAQTAADRVMRVNDFSDNLRQETPLKARDTYGRALEEIAEKVATQELKSPIDQQSARQRVHAIHNTAPQQPELVLPIKGQKTPAAQEITKLVSTDVMADPDFVEKIKQQAADIRAENTPTPEIV